jgi:hypothetical protein
MLPLILWWARGVSVWIPILLVVQLPAAFFLFGRRFSLDSGREMTIRQFMARLRELTHSEAGPVSEKGEPGKPGQVRAATIVQLAGFAVMAFGALLWLSAHLAFLHSAMSSLGEILPYAHWIVLGGFWLLLTVAARAGVVHGRNEEGQAHTDALWGAQLAAIFGVSIGDWQAGSGSFELVEGQTKLVVTNLPVAARMKLENAEARCSLIAPGWTIVSSSFDRCVLQRLELVPDIAAARASLTTSGGAIVAFENLPDSPARPEAVRWTLNTDSLPVAARIAELARSQGLSLVEFNSWSGTAIVARLPPETARLRDRLAGLLGYQPHEIEILVSQSMTESDDSYVSEVQILRAPAVLDPAKRRTSWMLAVKTALTPVAETIFRFDEDAASGSIRIRRLADPLREGFSISEFNERFVPAEANDSWKSFPIAVTEDGDAIPYEAFHTLGIGQTGAGKGSIWWAIFNGFLSSARKGLVEFYAIDPKGAEAFGADGRPLAIFEEVASKPDAWHALLIKLAARMQSRQGKGREQPVTTENPLIVILIDELSALGILDVDATRKKESTAALLTIASQGRSMNFFIVALAQQPQKEMIGNVREFLAMRVSLRVGQKHEVDMVLGDGAAEGGAEAHLIPIATSGNRYRTAGVGFVQIEGDPNPVRMRLPYASDAQISEWNDEFPGLDEPAVPTVPLHASKFEFSFDDQ